MSATNVPLLPALPPLPRPPANQGDLMRWAADVQKAMGTLYHSLSGRLESMVTQGADASKPAANGTRRFYYATDTLKLYYDDGTAWRLV